MESVDDFENIMYVIYSRLVISRDAQSPEASGTDDEDCSSLQPMASTFTSSTTATTAVGRAGALSQKDCKTTQGKSILRKTQRGSKPKTNSTPKRVSMKRQSPDRDLSDCADEVSSRLGFGKSASTSKTASCRSADGDRGDGELRRYSRRHMLSSRLSPSYFQNLSEYLSGKGRRVAYYEVARRNWVFVHQVRHLPFREMLRLRSEGLVQESRFSEHDDILFEGLACTTSSGPIEAGPHASHDRCRGIGRPNKEHRLQIWLGQFLIRSEEHTSELQST